MYEKINSQFFRTITGIQPRQDTLDKSRFVVWQIKVGYELFNKLGIYPKIMQFQISYRRESRKEIPE